MCFADYYRESLRFLGTVDVSTLTVKESVERAYDMGLSALVGKGIYNMGELLSHSILDSLRGTEKEWLVELLTAFNSGTSYVASPPSFCLRRRFGGSQRR